MYSRRRITTKVVHAYNHLAEQGPIGDLLLTLDRDVYDAQKANKKLRSFFLNILSKKFTKGLRVLTRADDGRVHIHAAVLLPSDCPNFDWRAFDQAQRWMRIYRTLKDKASLKFYRQFTAAYYRSMTVEFKELHDFVRLKGKVYGFGHVRLLPIRKVSDALKWYLVKNVPRQRQTRDKGIHFFSSWGCPTVGPSKLVSPESRRYRERLSRFSIGLGLTADNHVTVLRAVLGRNWHWQCEDMIKHINSLGTHAGRYEELKRTIRQHQLRAVQL
jgi:hypothetical protein